MKASLAEVGGFLLSLGNSAEEIADLFKRTGIKGRVGAACDCPVARAVKKQFVTPEDNGEDFAISRDSFSLNGMTGRSPAAVTEFISRFDSDEFSELAEVPDGEGA